MPIMREKRLNLGGVEVAIALEASRADRLRRTAPYRYAVRPALRWLGRLSGHGHGQLPVVSNGNGHPAPASHLTHQSITPTLPAAPESPEARALREQIAGIEWYHTIELPHGVTTPGFTDHRQQLPFYGLPDDLRGRRALDVATFDGFWAFEMERRGATVVAVDIGSWTEFDIPRAHRAELAQTGAADGVTGAGFYLARDVLGSRVDRQVLSVYELSPERVGTFDLVFLSDLLLHLRDPQRALERVCSVVSETGCAIIADVYHPDLEQFTGMALSEFTMFNTNVWWRPSTATLKGMMSLAGFKRVEEVSRFQLAAVSRDPIAKVVLKGYPV